MIFSRRELFAYVSTGSAAWYLNRYPWLDAWAAPSSSFFEAHGPIDRRFDDVAPAEYFGDTFDNAHEILWDLPGFFKKNAMPTKWEEVPLAVVGGGLSGLFTAYTFRATKPVVLEQADRFGGNAKGQSWRGTDFGLGSAYFAKPDAGTLMHKFYKELKIDRLVQIVPESYSGANAGKIYPSFWGGAAEPEHKAAYVKLHAFLNDVYEAKKLPYPAIPAIDGKTQQRLHDLDGKSFRQAIEEAVGTVPPLMARALECYSWSSMGGSPDEVSAAIGISFLAGEIGSICVAPGGNAGIAEHLLRGILNSGVPGDCLRPKSMVLKVTVDGERVKIVYLDPAGKVSGISARAAVMACPKYVVAKILEGIEPERLNAIREIEYRSYLTAGVLLDKPLRSRFYDLFLMNSNPGKAPSQAIDAVVGTFGQPRGKKTVLTLYRPMPAGSRAMLTDKGSYTTIRKQFQDQIEKELLPLLGFQKKNIVDLRVARWGHAIPLCKTGTFTKGTPQLLRKPFGTRLFFIEQDNWLTPSLETGVGEIALQEPLILAALGRKHGGK